MLFISMGHRAERWVDVANVKRYLKRKSLVDDFCSLNMTKKEVFWGNVAPQPASTRPKGLQRKQGHGGNLRRTGSSEGGLDFSEGGFGFSKPAIGFSKGGIENPKPGFGGVRTDTEKPFTRRLPPALGPGSRRERFGYCSKAGAAADGATARPQLAGKISGGGSGSSPLRCWDRGCRCFHRLPKWTS